MLKIPNKNFLWITRYPRDPGLVKICCDQGSSKWIERQWNRRVKYWSYWLVRSLVRLHRSLICLLRTTHSPTRSQAHEKEIYVCELNASIAYGFNPSWSGITLVMSFWSLLCMDDDNDDDDNDSDIDYDDDECLISGVIFIA